MRHEMVCGSVVVPLLVEKWGVALNVMKDRAGAGQVHHFWSSPVRIHDLFGCGGWGSGPT